MRTRESGLKRWMKAGLLGAAVGLGIGLGAATPVLAQGTTDKPKDLSKLEKKDQIIFRNGNKVDGVVLSETPTEVKFLVIFSGSMRQETSYLKSEILEIKRDAYKPAAKDDKKGDEKKDDKKDDAKDDDKTDFVPPGQIVDVNNKAIPPGTLKVYVVTFGGEFGRDLSKTPMKAVMDDIAAVQPDILVCRFDHTFGRYGEQKADYMLGMSEYDTLETARELDTLLMDRIRSDSRLQNVRPVAWIKKALGGAAFLPFTFQEIYYTSDALHGGIGGLERMFGNRGDDVVREKQRSLRLARAKGLAEKGGHDSKIMMAMSRGDFVLSYRMIGGQAELLERMPQSPDEVLLKDDGPVNPSNRDNVRDILTMKGNDYLTLDAKTAFEIGFSKGTADSFDELMSKMNITRNYAQVKNNSRKTLATWSKEIGKAEGDVERLLRQYREIEVKAPGRYEQRTAARTQQKSTLRKIQSIMEVYKEAINPARVGDADNVISDINVAIDRIDTQQRLDRKEP
jgi:hypothetical protein